MHNLNPFIALFFFSPRKLAERVHKGKKVRLFKDRHTLSQRRERRLEENSLAWGVESYVTSQRKSSPPLAF